MRRRRTFVAGMAAVGMAPRTADGQQLGRVYRIGFLGNSPRPPEAGAWDSLVAGLRDLGYVEGKNLHIARESIEGKQQRWPELANAFLVVPTRSAGRPVERRLHCGRAINHGGQYRVPRKRRVHTRAAAWPAGDNVATLEVIAVGTLLTLLLFCWAIVLTVTVAVWTAGAIILTIRAAVHLGRRP
jgi:hypothetical protein